MRPLFFPILCLAMAGCAGKPAEMFLITPPEAVAELPNRLGQVELREVALPQYAAAAEIAVQSASGGLVASSAQIWAESPVRAVTDLLAAQISALSGATVVAEPWPLGEGPDRVLEVRVEKMLAGADGLFHLEGQYFVSSYSGSGGDIARRFDLTVPLTGPGAAAVADAQARALQALARQIAQLG
jgi:uncharacterized lipoprotein YmbA